MPFAPHRHRAVLNTAVCLAGLIGCAMLQPAGAALVTSGLGPGGFESTTSTSGLLYWLRADAGVVTDADGNVSTWSDQSSRDNDFTQADAARQPTWVADGINGQPAVQFSLATPLSYATTQKLVLSTATQPQTIVIVNTTATQTSGLAGIIGLTNASGNSDFGIRRVGDTGWQHGGLANSNDFTTAGGAMSINGAATNLAAEGTAHIMTAVRGSPATLSPTTGLGDYFYYTSGVGPRPWAGRIGEVIVYNRALTAVEQTVLENALSAKYAIPLAANDHYAGDDAAHGDYDRDVIGIGAENGSQLTSAGSAGFGLEAQTLANGTYVMAGHAATTNSRIATNAFHGVSRWDRSWYVDKTGNAEVRIAFDSADAGLAAAAPNAQLALLYRETTTDSFSLVPTKATVQGTQAAFALSDTQIQDGYYTLAEMTPITGGAGPGGLESTSGSSRLLYWLKADAQGVTTEGNRVSAWNDQSGQGNHFVQADADRQPTWTASGFGANNLAAIRFDGDHSDPDGAGTLPAGDNADRLLLSIATSPKTVFLVCATQTNRSLDGVWGLDNGDMGIRLDGTPSVWQNPGNENTYNNSGALYVNGDPNNQSAANGTPIILTALGDSSLSATSLGNYFRYNFGSSRAWNGDMAEVIVYDRQLNGAERSVVENALSAKYGIALSANDHYRGDEAVHGDYDLDVIGVGCEDASNVLYNTGSAGLGIMAIVGTLDSGEWVLAGHRTPTNGLTSEGEHQRWDRVWYLDVTGEVDVSLTFDFSDAGLSTDGLDRPLTLLYSPTSDLEFTILALEGIQNGDQISFVVSSRLLADGYYTLGILPEPSALALLLLGGMGTLLGRHRTRKK